MDDARTTLNPDWPPMTAADLAAVLGKTQRAWAKRFRNVPATGRRMVSGNEAPEWHCAALPTDIRAELLAVAKASGFNTVGEMLRARAGSWQPTIKTVVEVETDNGEKKKQIRYVPISLKDLHQDCIDYAGKLRQALQPSLNRNPQFANSQADFEHEGAEDVKRIFGHCDVRWFRQLINRIRARDGERKDWGNLAIYLPEKLKRAAAAPKPAPVFTMIDDAIAAQDKIEAVKGERVVEISREELIWQRTFSEYDRLVTAGETKKRAARILRDYLAERAPSPSRSREALLKAFERRLARHITGEEQDRRYHNGKDLVEITWHFRSLGWAIQAAKHFCMFTNRTHDSGSLPEALRRLMDLPEMPAGWTEGHKRNFLKAIGLDELPTFPTGLRGLMLNRASEGKEMISARLAKEIRPSKSQVKFYRSPRDWKLANVSAPGSQRRCTDKTGQRVIMQPGNWFGGDDATPGIAVCIPTNEIITPCSQRYGVLLGRFQWLVYVDCRTDKILAWDYVIRPRGSYRAEDILNGMQAVTRTHGIPRRGWQLEGGTFNARLVRQAIQHLGCEHWRTNSPHQKSVEVVFGKVWTRLAVQFPHADMGRYRNENESNCKVYEGCKAGHLDPRKYFPMLADVVKAFDEEVKTHNASLIRSDQYGQWVPDDFFQAHVSANPLRPYRENMSWMFAPVALERTVRGMLVSCKLPMFENFSVPFDFGAEWLPEYSGQKVRIHFNPHDPKCLATVVLVNNYGPHKAGKILGQAQLIGETAQHVRYIMQWADDDRRAGYALRQKTESYVRRETRGIGVGGRVEYAKSEERSGLGQTGIVERGVSAPAPAPDAGQSSVSRIQAHVAEQSRAEKRAELEQLRRETAHIFGEDRAALDAEFERLNRETKPIMT